MLRWLCASLIPGITVRPPRSICFVCGPARAMIVAESPVAVMRSSRIARACTYGCPASLVKIFPLKRTMSGADGWLSAAAGNNESKKTAM